MLRTFEDALKYLVVCKGFKVSYDDKTQSIVIEGEGLKKTSYVKSFQDDLQDFAIAVMVELRARELGKGGK